MRSRWMHRPILVLFFSIALYAMSTYSYVLTVHGQKIEADQSLHNSYTDGLIDFLEVSSSPGISQQYNGMSPTRLDTTKSPYGPAVVIRNVASDVVFLPGETIDSLTNFTFSFYVKLDGFNYHNNIISLANNTTANEFIIAYNYSAGDKGIILVLKNELYRFPDSETALYDLEWHHIAVTRKDTLATLYVDGKPISSPIEIPSDALRIAKGGFVVGQDQDIVGGGFSSTQNIHGAIGGLYISHYALDSIAINGKAFKTCPPSGTPCDDGNTNTIQDQENGKCKCLGKDASKLKASRNEWLIKGLLVLLLLGAVMAYFITRRRKLEKDKLEKQRLEETHRRESVEKELKTKQNELTTKSLQLASKNEFLSSLKNEVGQLKSSVDQNVNRASRRLTRMIESDVANEEMWEQFSQEFNILHSDFLEQLSREFGSFTKTEIRLISLLKMNLSSKEIANILRITDKGLKKSRYRLRKKFELDSKINMQTYLINYKS